MLIKQINKIKETEKVTCTANLNCVSVAWDAVSRWEALYREFNISNIYMVI